MRDSPPTEGTHLLNVILKSVFFFVRYYCHHYKGVTNNKPCNNEI